MNLKPFFFGAVLATAAETVFHKEQTPHPIHEQHQDKVIVPPSMYNIGATASSNEAFPGQATLATLLNQMNH